MSTGAWIMLAIFVAGYVIGAAIYPWPWSLLRRRHRFAEGGRIPASSKDSDSVPMFISHGRVWRLVDGKLVEVDDRLLAELNKLRKP